MSQNGGDIIAQVFRRQGVSYVFTLCGGHISPILVGCKKAGIQVVDARGEAAAVCAAVAAARSEAIAALKIFDMDMLGRDVQGFLSTERDAGAFMLTLITLNEFLTLR